MYVLKKCNDSTISLVQEEDAQEFPFATDWIKQIKRTVT
jgi:hypothetical protein